MSNISKSSFRLFFIIAFALIFLITGCASKLDPITGEKEIINPNVKEKARSAADKGGGIMGMIGDNKDRSAVDFGTANILWRATIKTLDFLPIATSDYSGGIIGFDWYNENLNSDEQIKIVVKFLSNELRSDSINIVSHKKTCKSQNCVIVELGKNFSNEIKDKIITTARILKIEETKKNTK
ncbi:MAG: DUF3576 domain-containing protein [Pelagibacterales bacterium]|nr:DUF3576 domain-containing protein [Pelagibacterales bacterium]